MKKKKRSGWSILTVTIIIIALSFGGVRAEQKSDETFNPNDSLRFSSPRWNKTDGQAPFSVFGDSGQTEALNLPSPDQEITQKAPTDIWISYSISGTRLIWDIRGSGEYVGKCLAGAVKSNVDLLIRFEGFGDLQSFEYPGEKLETHYSATILDLPVEQLHWYTGSDFNNYGFLFVPKEATETTWSLWSKITVTDELLSGMYSNDASIIFLIRNVTAWVDPLP